MRILAYKGIVKNGQIELSKKAILPENTIVHIQILNSSEQIDHKFLRSKFADIKAEEQFDEITIEEDFAD